jgi:hypothetical protein
VQSPKEVKRFHIAIRRGAQGFSFKLTDTSSERVRKACAKAARDYNTDSWYVFDYDTQEAVILVPEKEVPLTDWKEAQAASTTHGCVHPTSGFTKAVGL